MGSNKIYVFAVALGLILTSTVGSIPGFSQKIAVKTNLLYDATATINVGVEVALAPKWTLDVSGNYNAWDFCNDRKWKHFLVQPEARYWLCETFSGQVVSAQLESAHVNAGNVALPV